MASPKSQDFKLKYYYQAVVVASLLVVITTGYILYYFSPHIPWIIHPKIHLWIFVGVAISQATFTILRAIFKKKIFFTLDRYAFIIFFFLLLYAEGGVNSPLVLVLVFPLIVSAIDLDEKATRLVGIIGLIGFTLLIFFTPGNIYSPEILIKYVIELIVLATITFYFYRMVKETLRLRYEKEEAKRKFDQLIQLDRVKTDFLTVASHQLRTPLSGISWGLETVLKDENLSADNRSLLIEIKNKVQNATSNVGDMLKSVDFHVDGFKLNPKPLNLKTIVDDVVASLAYLISTKQVKLTKNIPEILTVKADQRLLRAALINIFDNAIRYAPNAVVSISAESRETSPPSIQIVVRDTGIGIPKDDIPYIFERFYRGKNAIAIDPNESGVGLYTARKIIEQHGGTITLESREGEGSIVNVTIPANI